MKALELQLLAEKEQYLREVTSAEDLHRQCAHELREAHRQLAEAAGINVLKLSPLRGEANPEGLDTNMDGVIDVKELKKAISFDEKTSSLKTAEAERIAAVFNEVPETNPRSTLTFGHAIRP